MIFPILKHNSNKNEDNPMIPGKFQCVSLTDTFMSVLFISMYRCVFVWTYV